MQVVVEGDRFRRIKQRILWRRYEAIPVKHSLLYAPLEYSLIMCSFIELALFSRYRDSYFSDEQFAGLQKHLLGNLQAGSVVPGSGGVWKLRWKRAGMGKRGGLRIIYYVQDNKDRIWLLTVYGKSARENITAKDLR